MFLVIANQQKSLFTLLSTRDERLPSAGSRSTVQFPVRKKSLSRNLKLNGGLFLCKTKDSYSSFDGKNKTLALG